MIQQTVFPFKVETTKERLTAHGGLALMAERFMIRQVNFDGWLCQRPTEAKADIRAVFLDNVPNDSTIATKFKKVDEQRGEIQKNPWPSSSHMQ